jgi:hypothetical protein
MYRFIGVLQLMKRKEISSSAPGLSVMTLRRAAKMMKFFGFVTENTEI